MGDPGSLVLHCRGRTQEGLQELFSLRAGAGGAGRVMHPPFLPENPSLKEALSSAGIISSMPPQTPLASPP